jgi:hypothetical protein
MASHTIHTSTPLYPEGPRGPSLMRALAAGAITGFAVVLLLLFVVIPQAAHLVPPTATIRAAHTAPAPSAFSVSHTTAGPSRVMAIPLRAAVEDKEAPAAEAEPTPLTAAEAERAEFGYTRKDVILICLGVVAVGYTVYYGLQLVGLTDQQAGVASMMLANLGLIVGWTGTYVFRVGTKDMTYTKQLTAYEEQVMLKRYEEMSEEERAALAEAPVPKPQNPKSVRRWL